MAVVSKKFQSNSSLIGFKIGLTSIYGPNFFYIRKLKVVTFLCFESQFHLKFIQLHL